MTERSRPKERIVSAETPPHLAALAIKGTARPSDGSRYLPKPVKLRTNSMNAAEYVVEGRR